MAQPLGGNFDVNQDQGAEMVTESGCTNPASSDTAQPNNGFSRRLTQMNYAIDAPMSCTLSVDWRIQAVH